MDQKLPEIHQEWARTLANLAQVLETGLDKRTFDRPILGINISDFNASIARTMGVPVTDGIRLDFLPEEMGAFQAGLRKDDVVIALDGNPITSDFGSLVKALQGKKGGDKVEVTFYSRDAEEDPYYGIDQTPGTANPLGPGRVGESHPGQI